MITVLAALLAGMVVSWSTVAQAESPTCWSSAVCYKAENAKTEWLKIYPLPNCTSKSNISVTLEYTRIQQKFNRSIVDFFKGIESFVTNACSSCNLYQGIEIDDNRYSYSDAEECVAPVVCGVDGRTITDFVQIRPFPSCKSDNKPHETSWDMETLFNSSREYVVKELQNFLSNNYNLCQTTRMKNVIATLKNSLWKPIDTKQCYVPVICSEEANSSERWIKFPDPDCKSANLTLLSENPEKMFTSILEQARAEIQDIVEPECSKSYDEAEHNTTTEISQREAMASLASSGWYLIENYSRQYAYKLFREKVPYETARSKCSQMNARLACKGMRISTVRNQVIKEIIRPAGEETWIGLDDLQSQNCWMWADGVQSARSNTDWHRIEPNGVNERCVHMFSRHNYKLNDSFCTQNFQYLCEKVL